MFMKLKEHIKGKVSHISFHLFFTMSFQIEILFYLIRITELSIHFTIILVLDMDTESIRKFAEI